MQEEDSSTKIEVEVNEFPEELNMLGIKAGIDMGKIHKLRQEMHEAL